jgi:uncharacterized protein (DUF2345 family)
VLWNGQDKPPDTNENKKNDVRLIRSRSGHEIRLNDAQGEEKLEIIDKNGKNKLTFDTTSNTITITSNKDITLSAPNGKIKLSAQAVKLESTEKITLASQKDIDIKTNTEINLSGSLINLN